MTIEPEPRLIFSLRTEDGFVDGKLFSDLELGTVPQCTVCLNLENASVTDAGIRQLPSLPELRCIDLDNTNITDVSMGELSKMPNLEELWIESTRISDAGIQLLQQIATLRFISIVDCDISEAALDDLEAAIPDIVIH